MDSPYYQITAETYLSTQPGHSYLSRVQDCALSRLLEVATILLWHGVWSATDSFTRLHLCPGEDEYCQPGALLSLTIGRVLHSHWSRSLQILCSNWLNLTMLAPRSMP